MLRTSIDPQNGDRLFDICIVGGGVAGITLALELRSSALDVCLLESGSLTPHADSQALCTGSITGIYAPELDECRARCFGGSSNLWPGVSTPFDPLDFERRDWVYDGDWPFSYNDVAVHYPRAAWYCALRSNTFAPAAAAPEALGLDRAVWTARRAQMSTAPRFGERYAHALADAGNITVLLRANVAHIACDQKGTRVRHVIVRAAGQPPLAVRARTFVLAMGGIENARLLLASNDVHPRGIGNGNDLVGRFFMDHPVIHSVFIKPAARSLDLAEYASTPAGTDAATHYLQLQEWYVRAQCMTNVRVHVSPASDVEGSDAMCSYAYLRLCLRRRRWPRAVLHRLTRILLGSRTLRAYLTSRLTGRGGDLTVPRPDHLRLSIMCEQLPLAENRVTLTRARDALGVPRVRLEWRMSDQEHARARRVIDLLDESFRTAGIGRVCHLSANPDFPFEERLGFGHHAIGTTRASHDPRRGVVDGDGRVFGMENLFVAGSSIFPTSSHVPPTLSIVALAIRMAEQMASG